MKILAVIILSYIAFRALLSFAIMVIELIGIVRFHIDTRSSRKSRRISD